MVFRLAPVENATTRSFQLKSPLSFAAPQKQYRQKKPRYTELYRLGGRLVSCGFADFAHERSDLKPNLPWHFSVLHRRLLGQAIARHFR